MNLIVIVIAGVLFFFAICLFCGKTVVFPRIPKKVYLPFLIVLFLSAALVIKVVTLETDQMVRDAAYNSGYAVGVLFSLLIFYYFFLGIIYLIIKLSRKDKNVR